MSRQGHHNVQLYRHTVTPPPPPPPPPSWFPLTTKVMASLRMGLWYHTIMEVMVTIGLQLRQRKLSGRRRCTHLLIPVLTVAPKNCMHPEERHPPRGRSQEMEELSTVDSASTNLASRQQNSKPTKGKARTLEITVEDILAQLFDEVDFEDSSDEEDSDDEEELQTSAC